MRSQKHQVTSHNVEPSLCARPDFCVLHVGCAGIHCQKPPVAPEIHGAEASHSLHLFQFTEDLFPARRELEMKAG